MNYPSINEYKEAILFAEDNFEQLKNLRPVLDEEGNPVMTGGNFAEVFKMKDEQTGKIYAVKCFLREQEGRAEAYRQIAEELEYVSSTFLTPIKYLDKELFVDTNAGGDTEFPVLLMDWVEGETLDKFIRKHLDDQYELSLLAYQFSRLAMWLMPQPFAHGDLKPDNILVKSDGTLVLVDYDGMYVPAMKGQRARELGSPDFRHPSRTETDFDEHIDDFSLASILLSLKAISLQPSLLEEYGASDRLLFSEKDYRNLSESETLNELRPLMHDAELASLYSLFILALSQNNLSQVSFRLFNLSRPKEPELADADLDAWAAAIEENVPHDNKRCWPLLEFARLHGKMQVGEFANKETGETFKSCIFTKLDGTRLFVAFSAAMGELTPKDIAAMKEELVVVEKSPGKYSLCKRNTYDDTKSINTRLCSKENIINRELRLKSSNSKFGIIDIEEKYAEGSSWRTKLGYYNIFEDGIYNLSDIESIKYDKEKDLVQIDFRQLIDDKYDSIFLSRQFEKIHMEFYRHHILTMEFNSRYDKASFPLEDLFYAFCSLSLLESENAIVTINGEAFHVKYIQNCYTEAQMKSMEPLENIRFIYDEIDEEILSTVVTEDDLANAWTDEYGVKYSADKKRLLKASDNIKEYTIKEGTKVICNNAFKGCKTLSSISIPYGIIIIGESAFWNQKQLKTVVIPDSVTSIDKLAFFGCSGLELIKMSSNLKVIGDRAFYACAGLTNLTIPSRIEKIGESVFQGCINLKRIIVDPNNKNYDSRNNCNAIINSRNNTLIVGCSSTIIPDTVTKIGDESFFLCKNLKTINIPDSVKEIGYAAFPGCDSLLSVIIPQSVEKIGNAAFCDCRSLAKVEIKGAIREIPFRLFYNCIALKEVSIPQSITKIDDEAFVHCSKMSSLYIPIGTLKKFEELLPEYKDKLVEQEMGWIVKSTRSFDPEEIAAVRRAEVVASQYGNSICFFMNAGGQTYIPLSKQSKLAVGDELDLRTSKILTLVKGKDEITRIIE